jgi:hypothetical protein
MVTRVSVFILLVIGIASCHGLGPEPSYWRETHYSNTFYASAPFSFIVNGLKISRSDQDARGAITQASAKLEPNWLFGSGKILTIDLDPDNGQKVELQIEIHNMQPATYYITPSPRPDSATAVFTNSYYSDYNMASGVVNIFAVDTVNNTVSGTFSFSATDRNGYDTMRVLAGSFSSVPLYVGSYRQGYVTALAENQYFTSTTSDYGATAYAYNKSQGLHIQAHAMDQFGSERIIRLYVENPRVATFSLSPNGYSDEGTSYQNGSASLRSGSGTLKITAFDTATHRLSGTFNFTVEDYNSATIRIANGVIENLQWFVL